LKFEKEYLTLKQRINNLICATHWLMQRKVPSYSINSGEWSIQNTTLIERLSIAYSAFDTFLRGYWYIGRCCEDVITEDNKDN
jgi:hypothetical protein